MASAVDTTTIANHIRTVILASTDAPPFPAEHSHQPCFSAVAAACVAGKPQAVYAILSREIGAAVDGVLRRLVF